MISTAKHKAIELVDKFANECLLTTEGAKVAALIAVNAMIETVSMCIPFLHEYTYIEFWEEVKIEIEKL